MLTADIRALFLGHCLEVGDRGVGAGQEFVDVAVGMAVDDPGDDVGEVGLRIDGVEFAGFDERSDDGPMLGSFIRRDLMMPGVWGVRWRSPIRSIRFLGSG